MTLKSAIEDNNTEEIKSLIADGININDADEQGKTPLMWAAQTQSPAMIKLLLELGANPKLEDKNGNNALGIACWYGEYRMGAYTHVCKQIIDIFKGVGVRLK